MKVRLNIFDVKIMFLGWRRRLKRRAKDFNFSFGGFLVHVTIGPHFSSKTKKDHVISTKESLLSHLRLYDRENIPSELSTRAT